MNQSLTHSLYVLSLSELEPDSFMRALTHLHSLKIHSNNLSTANLSSKLCFFIFFGGNGQYLTVYNILYCNVLS